jgi:hypothetical protein
VISISASNIAVNIRAADDDDLMLEAAKFFVVSSIKTK